MPQHCETRFHTGLHRPKIVVPPPAGDQRIPPGYGDGAWPIHRLISRAERAHTSPPEVSLGARLRSLVVATFGQVLQDVNAVALLGYPGHRNAGDALIWDGQCALLRDLKIPILAVADHRSYDPSVIKDLPAGTAVLISGGGNFGDLYPDFERFRHQILHDAAGRHVVQMPQSLYFRDPAAADRARRAAATHPSLVLTWRDARSYRSGSELFPRATSILVPDMAFAAEPPILSGTTRVPVLSLARADSEGGELRQVPLPEGRHSDWPAGGLRLSARSAVWKGLEADRRLGGFVGSGRVRRSLYRHAAAVTVRAATRLVSGADVVVSDRLHAHILCTMLGVPHVMVDSGYGKIQAFVDSWTAGCPLLTMASSAPEAIVLASKLAIAVGECGRSDGRGSRKTLPGA